MKPIFTPLEKIDSLLKDEMGKKAIKGLAHFIPDMEKEFERVKKALPFELTDEAKQKYIDLENINSDLKKYILESGLLVDFDWENWLEGKEILEGIRPLSKTSNLKICKMLTLIVKRDTFDFEYFGYQLRKGTILKLLKNLSENTET
ncbi:DUF6508 domain-containing protein [Shivajiella indica]|uniref:DUF6508 domain-containing protein n=1 Tax=Shivajiella indica TaxID=872115 RepID=A0ABW5BCC1_9BACT